MNKVTACPHCDCPDINERVNWEPKYRCMGCGETFEEPIERDDRRSGTGTSPQSSIGRALLEAEPGDIGESIGPLRSA